MFTKTKAVNRGGKRQTYSVYAPLSRYLPCEMARHSAAVNPTDWNTVRLVVRSRAGAKIVAFKYRYRLASQPVFAPFFYPLTIVRPLDHCCQGGTSALHSPCSLPVELGLPIFDQVALKNIPTMEKPAADRAAGSCRRRSRCAPTFA